MKVRIYPQIDPETKAKVKFYQEIFQDSFQQSVDNLIKVGFENHRLKRQWYRLTDEEKKQYYK